ncbi:MAG TPA: hypothetical protein VF176_01520 [Solirubrobacterales bacterium]
MSEPAFDELMRRLAAADVDFVVVGGLAVNARRGSQLWRTAIPSNRR